MVWKQVWGGKQHLKETKIWEKISRESYKASFSEIKGKISEDQPSVPLGT
jgi:hypothetical protein